MSFTETLIKDLCSISLDDNLIASLSTPLSLFNSVTTNIVISIMRDSVYAVGASLLTLFMLLEMVSIINRSGADEGLNGIKLPANLIIKFAVLVFLYCRLPNILLGIEEICANLAANIASSASYNTNVGISESQITMIANAIGDLSFFDKIFTYITLLVDWLLVKGIFAICSLTVFFRIFEIYILLMLSPIPLSTIANQEFKETAKNFLKAFFAVCLQGTVIIACFVIYNSLMSSNLINLYDPTIDISEYITSVLINNIIFAMALAVTVFSSGRLVNKILNVIA